MNICASGSVVSSWHKGQHGKRIENMPFGRMINQQEKVLGQPPTTLLNS